MSRRRKRRKRKVESEQVSVIIKSADYSARLSDAARRGGMRSSTMTRHADDASAASAGRAFRRGLKSRGRSAQERVPCGTNAETTIDVASVVEGERGEEKGGTRREYAEALERLCRTREAHLECGIRIQSCLSASTIDVSRLSIRIASSRCDN